MSFDQPMLNGTTFVVSHIPSRRRAIADAYKWFSRGSAVALKVFRCDPPRRENLKMVNPHSCHQDTLLSWFLQLLLREAPTWYRISVHPNILPILLFYDDQDTKDFTAIASPWQENGDLTRYLCRFPNADRLRLVRAPDTFTHQSNILTIPAGSRVLGRHDLFTFQCDRTRKSTSGTLKQFDFELFVII
jgi:serine/threonine protein kinase